MIETYGCLRFRLKENGELSSVSQMRRNEEARS